MLYLYSFLCVFTGLEPSITVTVASASVGVGRIKDHAAVLAPLRYPRSFTAYQIAFTLPFAPLL
jgi:hypothetical protein